MLFRTRHFAAASVLHALVFALLVLGVQCSPKIQKPAVIEAMVITGKNKAGKVMEELPRAEPAPEPKPEPPKPAPEPPKPEPPKPEPPKPEPPKPEPPKPDPAVERRKLEEQEEKKKIEEARKQKEREERERVEIERQKAREEEERKRQEEAKQKAEEEAKRKAEEEARRKAAEEEARRKAAEERAMREAFERSMNQEAEARAEAAYIAEVQKSWAQELSEHIARNWLRPPNLDNKLNCQVEINLLPNGEVVNVRVIRSSGNPSFDDSVVRAVLKSSPMPLPRDPKAFDRVLKPNFTPELLDQLR